MEKENENGTELKIEYVKIDDLIQAEYNPRKLTEADRQAIKASIKRFGIVDPIIVNKNPERKNIIIGGHQRCLVAKEDLGIEEVPCVFVDLTLDKERELNIRLNKNTGRFDEELLQLHFTQEFLKEVGFKEDELQFFQTEFEKELDKYNDKNCEMPLVPKFSEKYDAVIIVSTNSIDTTFLKNALHIEKAKSYKNGRTGEAMIIDVEHFKNAVYGD